MKRLSRVLLAVGMSLLFATALWGQGFSVSLTATDGFAAPVTLTVGTSPDGSYGIDVAPNPLAEYELPPVPPGGIFDCRLVGIPGHVAELKGGVNKDIRHYDYATQPNTYKVTFQIGSDAVDAGSDSLQLSWPAGLGSIGGGYWHLKSIIDGGFDYDMTAVTSAKISSDYATGFYIVMGDVHAYTTVTYSRFWQDLYLAKIGKAQKRDVKVWSWPNVSNIGAEELKTVVPIFAQIGSDPVKSVYVKKYADLLKDAYDAKGLRSHSKDSIFCLDNYHNKVWKSPVKGAPLAPQTWKKQLKSLPPVAPPKAVMENYFFAQLLTLKFNLAASLKGTTPAGLGGLIIQDGGVFDGMTINAFVTAADAAISCVASTQTLAEFTTMCENINKAFNKSVVTGATLDTCHFDTIAIADGGAAWRVYTPDPLKPTKVKAPKYGNLKLAGWVSLREVTWLRTPPATAPIANPQTAMEATPNQYRLDQNYPNPFNPTTNIKFNLMNDGIVTVKVFNLLGQEVATLASQEQMTAGEQEVSFDANALASGVYLYRISVQDEAGKVMFQDMKKMMLVK